MFKLTKKVAVLLNRVERRFAFLLGVFMMLGGIVESLSVSLILPLVSAISSPDGWENTWYARILCRIFHIAELRSYIKVLLLLLIFLFLFKNAYLLLERYLQYDFIAGSRYRMQRKLMHSYLHKPYSFFLAASSGEIVRVINNDAVQAYNVLTSLLALYTELFVCVILSVTLIAIDPVMSCFFVILLLLELLCIAKIIRPIMNRIGNENRKYSAEMNRWMLASINGIKSIKVSNTGDYFEEMYGIAASRAIDLQKKNQTFNSMPKSFIEAFSVAAVLGFVFVMVISGTELSELVPLLSTFAIAALRLLPSISSISANTNNLKYLEGGIDNILAVLKEFEGENTVRETAMEAQPMTFRSCICIQHLTFAYPNSKQVILRDVCFTIHPGESVGIIGASGAGKTTVVDILLGLLKPNEGAVLVDGVNIENNLTSWLSNLAYIPQQIFLMEGSIRNNVAFGIPDHEISEERVWRALKDAQLDEFVLALPEGLDTNVGERGIRLSGGQCQRIGIARALYPEPSLLVFDEATSALDNDTEAAIMNAINQLKGKKTMIIIAHRLTTIEKCDVVYKVENQTIRLIRGKNVNKT